MTRRVREFTNANVDHHRIPSPKKKYNRLRKSESKQKGFCLLYPLVGLGLIVLYILS